LPCALDITEISINHLADVARLGKACLHPAI
jgi:hypothetical protein